MSDCVYPCVDAKPCTCAPSTVTKYQKRISGLLLDRIDIHIEVPRVNYEKLCGNRLGETSEAIRQHVQAARELQLARFSNSDSRNANIVSNADCAWRRLGDSVSLMTKVKV